MSKDFSLDQGGLSEVRRIYNLYNDRNELDINSYVKETLWQFKRLYKTYSFPSLFHSLKMHFHDLGVIERYINNDPARASYCFSLSARCGYLMDVTGGKSYSGGYDCLHVYSMLGASLCGDFHCADRFLEVFPGPARKGHLSSVILCNGLYNAIRRESSMAFKQIVNNRKDSRYYLAMYDALIGIMDKSKDQFIGSIITILKLQKRQTNLMYLERVFSGNAQALCRIWIRLNVDCLDELNLCSLWDNIQFRQPCAALSEVSSFGQEFPVFNAWVTTLPKTVEKEELLQSINGV